jgi:hypothetical protein
MPAGWTSNAAVVNVDVLGESALSTPPAGRTWWGVASEENKGATQAEEAVVFDWGGEVSPELWKGESMPAR